MSNNKHEHSHWDRYYTRTIEIGVTDYLEGGISVQSTKEYLQCICIEDGIIFNEVEVTRE